MRDAWTGVANSATHGPRLAALFYRSNWTQEQLAKKEGKGQSWIARQVLFGRVLSFMPMGINAETTPKNLTEGKFRSYWQQTDKSPNERARFMQVLDPRPWRHALAARPNAIPAKVVIFTSRGVADNTCLVSELTLEVMLVPVDTGHSQACRNQGVCTWSNGA